MRVVGSRTVDTSSGVVGRGAACVPAAAPRALSAITKDSTPGDGRVEVDRDLLPELAGGVQRSGQRDVLDDRHPGLDRLVLDDGRDRAGALRHDARRGLAGLVLERHA